jgi:hypothetical protein
VQQVYYPENKHDIGYSPCYWWTLEASHALQEELRKLQPGSVYMELGSFLGAGSTTSALLCREDLQVVCVDNWKLTAAQINYEPTNAFITRMQYPKTELPTDYWKGIGTSLQHFQNNTFQWKNRVRMFQGQIGRETLYDLKNKFLLKPNLILIDDHHQYNAVVVRLEAIKELWPTAIIAIDDYTVAFDEVRQGVEAAFKSGWYSRQKSRLTADRMCVLYP